MDKHSVQRFHGYQPGGGQTSQAGGRALGSASGQIYWVSTGEIWAANLDGGGPHAIVTGQTLPAGVAANAGHVYWADDGNDTAGNGTMMAADPDGTSPHAIVTGQISPSWMAVTPTG